MVDSIRKTGHVGMITPPRRLPKDKRRDRSDQDGHEKQEEHGEGKDADEGTDDHFHRVSPAENPDENDTMKHARNPKHTGRRINLRI